MKFLKQEDERFFVLQADVNAKSQCLYCWGHKYQAATNVKLASHNICMTLHLSKEAVQVKTESENPDLLHGGMSLSSCSRRSIGRRNTAKKPQNQPAEQLKHILHKTSGIKLLLECSFSAIMHSATQVSGCNRDFSSVLAFS